jgi:hypothetical protein
MLTFGFRGLLPGLVLMTTTPAAAFHEGGVAACEGCHSVHNSQDGQPLGPELGNNYQLLAGSPTEVCLMCHAQEAGRVLGLSSLAPPPELGAGNFVFLLEDNLNDSPSGRLSPIRGEAAGHSIVAPAISLLPDSRHSTAPGGSFPAAALGCTSCHDPHGNGNFRMLNGVGEIQGGLAVFDSPAPRAQGVDIRVGQETRSNHSAYQRGVSRWCSNCHGMYHGEGSPDFRHPIDRSLGASELDRYNRYDGDENPIPTSQGLAYLPEVPFEDDSASVSSRRGPSPTSRIMCLTCHRAHASSAPASGRWDFNVSLLVDDGSESGSWAIPNPYTSPRQGTLCRKCHQTTPD